MSKSGSKKMAVLAPVLAWLLLLALILPAALTPSTIEAQDIEAYALIQIPSQEKEDSLKPLVISVFDSKNVYAIVGCTEDQLDDLPGNGYTVIEQCTGDEDQCLSQLTDSMNSLGALVSAPGLYSFGYTYIDSNTAGGPDFYWVDISGTGTNTGIHCDDCGVVVPIGFTFNFDGNNHNTIGISSNGYLTFGEDRTDWSSDCIPNANDPNDAIFPFWDDLQSEWCEGSEIYYETRTIAGKTVFIVQWVGNDFCCSCHGISLNFEAILFQDSNAILFQYNDMTGATSYYDPNRVYGSGATIGLENIDGTAGLQYSCDSSTIDKGLAILFCPGNINARNCVEAADLSGLPRPQKPKPKAPSQPAATAPPLILAKELEINQKEAYIGQPITISASMANEGDNSAEYTAELKINGQTEQLKTGNVDGHSSVPVSFTVTRSQPGTYTVDLSGQKGTFTVLAHQTNSNSPASSSPTIAIILIGALVLCAAGILIVALRRTA